MVNDLSPINMLSLWDRGANDPSLIDVLYHSWCEVAVDSSSLNVCVKPCCGEI